MRLRAAIGLALGAGLIGPAALAQATLQGLGDLPGGASLSRVNAVSADGSVAVGVSRADNGGFDVNQAFRWEGGVMVGLGYLPGALSSEAFGVSGDGDMVSGTSSLQMFRWSPSGGMVNLPGLAGGDNRGEARGVTVDGSAIVGGATGPSGTEAFRWTAADGTVGLGDLPGGSFASVAFATSEEGSVVVGYGSSASGTEAFRSTDGAMTGLGDLPGGAFLSDARDVSGDGTVVVGYSNTAVGLGAFRWSALTGMVELGHLPGASSTVALGVSDDGTIVVGSSGLQAFIWSQNGGMRSVRDVLIAAGVNVEGWSFGSATGISADGTVVVGNGTNPQGQAEAWRAVLPRIAITAPTAGDLVIGGEETRVRFRGPGGTNPLELYLLPDTLGATAQAVAVNIPATDIVFAWTVPTGVFSRSARLVLRVMADTTVADTSDYFRIRPYHLARLAADSVSYTRFRPSLHGWIFGNTQANLFPPEWIVLEQFDYQDGDDPFTFLEYPEVLFTGPPINAVPVVFADWPAAVRAFGTDDAYWVRLAGLYNNNFVARWGSMHGGRRWNGSCYGMAVTALMAFTDRLAFGAAYPEVGPVENLATVGMSAPVRELANMQYSRQFGSIQQANDAANLVTTTPTQTVSMLRTLLLSDASPGSAQRHLAIYDVQTCAPTFSQSGGHSVVPYRLERDPAVQGAWRVYIYDPNYPLGEGQVIVVDSTTNTWNYTGFSPSWGGACGFYLEPPVATFYQEAGMRQAGDATRIAGGDSLYVAAAPGADVTLTDVQGRRIGYTDSTAFNEIPGARALVPKVGGHAPPNGYFLPDGAYGLTMTGFPENRAAAYFFPPEHGAPAYVYGRADADSGETDRVSYEPSGGNGLRAVNHDAGTTKLITLRALLDDGFRERTLDARALNLVGADSARFATLDAVDGPALRLANEGGPKTYTLYLRQASTDGEAHFRHVGVPLGAGATHTARPDWATLGTVPVEVDIDLNGDGIPDEVLVLENQPVASEPGTGGRPTQLALHQPAPNPGAGQIAIRFDLPTEGQVRLVLHDVLGRQVAVLVDESRTAESHTVSLEAARFAPGTYSLRLDSGGQTVTRWLTIAR